MNWAIGLDVGGTKIAGALVSQSGEQRNFVTRVINAKGEHALEIVLQVAEHLVAQAKENNFALVGIGVAVPGAVDLERGRVQRAPNLDWLDLPLVQICTERLKLRTMIELDVRATALGEMLSGVAKDVSDFVYLTIGTGIGAGIVIAGKLLYGHNSTSGEIGHCVLIKDGPICGCGQRGCLEALAAGPAISERARRALMNYTNPTKLAEYSEKNGAIEPRWVFEAAQAGDKLALSVVSETADYIGRGLSYLINLLNPEKIIIGGGVAKAGEFFFQLIRYYTARYTLYPAAKRTEILSVSDPDLIPVAGAANLVFTRT